MVEICLQGGNNLPMTKTIENKKTPGFRIETEYIPFPRMPSHIYNLICHLGPVLRAQIRILKNVVPPILEKMSKIGLF